MLTENPCLEYLKKLYLTLRGNRKYNEHYEKLHLCSWNETMKLRCPEETSTIYFVKEKVFLQWQELIIMRWFQMEAGEIDKSIIIVKRGQCIVEGERLKVTVWITDHLSGSLTT